jgi:glycerol uptake facilitator-like aquaporin
VSSVRQPLIAATRVTQTVETPTCFYEANPSLPLLRRGLVEGVGTLLLMFIVTASATLPSMQQPHVNDARMFVAALAVPAALVSLVVAFGAVSGGHFNPLITFLQWLARERTSSCTLTYIGSQTAGAMLGACLAGELLGLKRSATPTAGQGLWSTSEVVATAGLLVVVLGCARSGRADTGPFAVGAWLLAIAVTLPSAFANPALTLGTLVAAGPVALGGADVLRHVPSQFLGALLAFALIRAAYAPRPR